MFKKKFLLFFITLITYLLLNFQDNAYSQTIVNYDAEYKEGQKIAKEIESYYKIVKDPVVQERLNKIGERLQKYAREFSGVKDLKLTIKAYYSNDVNAFALPGGFIFVTTGMLNFVRTDDELACILSHETGHVVLDHHRKQMELQKKYTLVALAVIIASRGNAAASESASLLSMAMMNQYSIGLEKQADEFAIKCAMACGYNPVGLLTTMERLNARERSSQDINWGIYQNHPDTEERIKYIIADLKKYGVIINRRIAADYFRVTNKGPNIYIEKDLWFNLQDYPEIFPNPFIDLTSVIKNLNLALNEEPNIYDIRVINSKNSVIIDIKNIAVITAKNTEENRKVLEELSSRLKNIMWKNSFWEAFN
ncbi:peptidase M48 Ste24p [Thermodesulfobium narugense DSM 14796]|uniref:Peptidase M48 Ste24p n=1 Tax=Thermodesulfobium narugense DSM 14796 TaxID=747365 RepID=M1E5M8_9BACT|nr:M48 family metallopeptidase [Thermodesulfobium narugense]AEE14356.1 peptidase M48 Ste24p [Thermodesulfobium narugense DSM 14796]